jgi:hypothetical protein
MSGGRQVIIYVLIEHQSEPDPLMVFRVLEYVVLIYRRQTQEWQRQHGSLKGFRFSPVLPVVLYTGTRSWDRLGRLAELVELGDELADVTPHLEPLFLNLGQVSDVALEAHGGGFGWLLRLIRLRKVRQAVFEETLRRAVAGLERLADREQGRWLDLLSYLHALVYHEREPAEQPGLHDQITASARKTGGQEGGEMAKTMAEVLKEEGREEGKAEAAVSVRREMLLRLLRTRFGKLPPRVINRIKAATSTDQLDAWSDEFAKANKLSDLTLAAEE